MERQKGNGSLLQNLHKTWFFNVRLDVLSGITIALALIPESIAFSLIAGVDPMVGLYASFCIAVIIAFVGGRSGMISAATGAMALVVVTLVANHGVEYLLAATILTGIIQVIFGILRFGKFISFVPQSVLSGFLNSLAILIFIAQLRYFVGAGPVMYVIVAATLVIIYLLPKFTKAVPSALVAIVVMSTLAFLSGFELKTVGDLGTITRSVPFFHLPQVEYVWSTFLIIFPYSLTLAIVGLIESLLTATIIDEYTNTKSNKNHEARGQGIANFVTGFFGGMAGCAMIGQSLMNMRFGGRGRLSTFVAGMFLLALIYFLGDIVMQIPMAALIGVMMMIAATTFDWKSVKQIGKGPASDTIVMVVTVAVVLTTNNLALGVVVGILLSVIMAGWRKFRTTKSPKISPVVRDTKG